jgi:molecular chaperone GrpE
MTSTVFDKSMKRFDVEEFNPEGKIFDPQLHEAVFMVDDKTKDPNTVAVVVQTGWTIGRRVLRAAKVGCVQKR